MFSTNKLRKTLAIFALVAAPVLMSLPTSYAQMGGGSGMGMGGSQNPVNMGGGMGGMMLLSGANAYRHDGAMVTMDDAIDIAGRFMNSLGNSALALDEVEEWEFNYYVVVKEAAPSQYKAFQLIIDKWTGSIMPEPGPSMMWNQKYGGMMNSMTDGMPGHMNRRDRKMTEPTFTVTPEAATSAANQFLRERFRRPLVVDGVPDVFFGYYNFDVNDAATGAKYGMLSVNGSTGQIWYHTLARKLCSGERVELKGSAADQSIRRRSNTYWAHEKENEP